MGVVCKADSGRIKWKWKCSPSNNRVGYCIWIILEYRIGVLQKTKTTFQVFSSPRIFSFEGTLVEGVHYYHNYTSHIFPLSAYVKGAPSSAHKVGTMVAMTKAVFPRALPRGLALILRRISAWETHATAARTLSFITWDLLSVSHRWRSSGKHKASPSPPPPPPPV